MDLVWIFYSFPLAARHNEPWQVYIIMLQGYHGLSKDDDRLWAMEIDREHSRGGGVLHHSHNPAHPLGWTGLVESLPPPPGALPLPPPPPPHNSLAGDPNGHPPPGNSGTPVSTGQVRPGQATAGSLLDLVLLARMPAPAITTSIIYQLGTAGPGAEEPPARPLVPTTPTTTRTPTRPAGRPRPAPPPPPPAWSGRGRGGAGQLSAPAGSGGRQTPPRSGLSPTLPGTPQCRAGLLSMVTITLLLQAGRWPTVMTRGQPAGSGDLSPASSPGHTTLELLSQVGPLPSPPLPHPVILWSELDQAPQVLQNIE